MLASLNSLAQTCLKSIATKTGHLKRDCRRRIRSDSGDRNSRTQEQPAKANTKTVESSPSPTAQQGAVDPLCCTHPQMKVRVIIFKSTSQ